MFGAHTIRRPSCLQFTFILGLFLALFLSPTTVSAMSADQLLSLTNQQRQANGLEPLRVNKLLEASAAAKARHMLAHDYWSHDAPDGTQPWTFVENSGYGFVAAGENLAKDFSTDQAVVQGWMNSPTHRDNILSTRYQEMGVAVIEGSLQGRRTILIVAHYAQPIARQKAPEPAPVQREVPVQSTNRPQKRTSMEIVIETFRRQKQLLQLQGTTGLL